jgi:hypothetical protein
MCQEFEQNASAFLQWIQETRCAVLPPNLWPVYHTQFPIGMTNMSEREWRQSYIMYSVPKSPQFEHALYLELATFWISPCKIKKWKFHSDSHFALFFTLSLTHSLFFLLPMIILQNNSNPYCSLQNISISIILLSFQSNLEKYSEQILLPLLPCLERSLSRQIDFFKVT